MTLEEVKALYEGNRPERVSDAVKLLEESIGDAIKYGWSSVTKYLYDELDGCFVRDEMVRRGFSAVLQYGSCDGCTVIVRGWR